MPIKRIDIIKLKTGHLSGIELDDKSCSWETTTRSELITILVEEEDSGWSFLTEKCVPSLSIFLNILPKHLRTRHIYVPLRYEHPWN
jgi:hypothetical protein